MTDAQRQLIHSYMTMIARYCVRTALGRKTTPAALGLYVDQEEHRVWHIRARHDATCTSLPAGSGVLEWDTDRYPDVESAFQAALAAAWLSRESA